MVEPSRSTVVLADQAPTAAGMCRYERRPAPLRSSQNRGVVAANVSCHWLPHMGISYGMETAI